MGAGRPAIPLLLSGAFNEEKLNHFRPIPIYCYAKRCTTTVAFTLRVDVGASIDENLGYLLLRVIRCLAKRTTWISINVSACIGEKLNHFRFTPIYCYAKRRAATVVSALCVNVRARIDEKLSYFLLRVIR